MSCIHCDGKNIETTAQYPCLCDQFVHPFPLNIGAGLDKLPRRIATFHEFRKALLKDIKAEEVELIDSNNVLVKIIPLSNWRARDKDDFGIMLLEMWAYICDSLSFYDEVVANETYLRTSLLRPNLRKLVALLGYLPRPAIGSVVELAALADGRLQLKLPEGTAFRSGAFDGNPPQVFELTEEAIIHPFANRMGIKAPHPGIVTSQNPTSLLVELKSEIKEETMLLLINKADNDQNKGVLVEKIEKYTGIDNRQYTKITFNSTTGLHNGALLKDLQLLKPTLTAHLWTLNQKADSISDKKITLNVLSQQIHSGAYILMTYLDEYRWFKVESVSEVMRSTVASNEIKINGNIFSMPGISNPVTELTLDESVNSTERKLSTDTIWGELVIPEITVYYGMQLNAAIVDEPNKILSESDLLLFDKPIETPVEDYDPKQFLLLDKNTLGASVGGSISYDENKLTLDQGTSWDNPLTLPVDIYGNVITASRGETVETEKLGSGNASLANQAFKLKKKPLTYFISPTADNDQSVQNYLEVYVNGIRWTEVSSFYGMTENDQVYIVRQNDDGESIITFGDGIRGQRLPSGKDNITCNYRFGAESACPPAGSISQVSKPVKRLRSVKNILSAFGGADAEDADNMRSYAPKSALILGRVVSMQDMEALAASYPGVRAVQAEWRWDKNKQQASAHIFYIGDVGIKSNLSQHIRSFADPTTPITVEIAISSPLSISLNVKIDSRYLEEDVVSELREYLTNTDRGLLAPENIGIGLPLFRSRIFDSVLNVKGTESVQGILIDGINFGDFATIPGTGKYFDIEQGQLIINGYE
ncbi:MAG: hypothetical protein EOM83_02200 [Clostridia bacterium]|nr:hypothetical protein [Clostridia bacterium]